MTEIKKIARGQKNDFFWIFLFNCTSTHLDATLIPIKISYLQPFREIMGGQRIQKFSAKMTPQAKKMTFFRIFFLAHLHIKAQLFCFYQNSISSAVQRNHGGTRKKRYINDDDERGTNERRTNYIDDHNTPSGFSESSG